MDGVSGKQVTPGMFSPPVNTKIRKAIFIATPHFGSFLAANPISELFEASTETEEMESGSEFLLNLGTWNQFGDDLRGTDALAIIGNASSNNESDGVVYLNSASVGFAEPSIRTRIVDYCHIDFTQYTLAVAVLVGCTQPGIAYITSTSHPTYTIIQSFLANSATNTGWENTAYSTTPSQNSHMSQSGGVYFTAQNAANQYLGDLSNVYFGNGTLENGALSNTIFYDEFLASVTSSFQATSKSLGEITYGPFAIPLGQYTVFHAKLSPAISYVSPLLPNGPGTVVQVGGTITIHGVGFGSQQCSGCQVIVAPSGSQVGYSLPVSSWSDQSISASFMPSATPNLIVPGLVTVFVELSSSAWASLNIMTAPTSTIAVTPSSLQFAYTVGGTAPAAQSVQITNSSGTLNWSATSSAPWLSVASASGTAPSTLSVLVSPNGLAAGTYTGTVQISGTGASNGSVSVAVTLTVTAASASVGILAVSPQGLTFNYTIGGAVPAARKELCQVRAKLTTRAASGGDSEKRRSAQG